jgi:DNA-binding NarL/FixJ family response regulator
VEVVSVTSFIEEERVHAPLTAGSAGYSLKDAEADEVAAAVRSSTRAASTRTISDFGRCKSARRRSQGHWRSRANPAAARPSGW